MSRVLTCASRWAGCNKWRDVEKVGVLVLDQDWGWQGAWLEGASEWGLLHVSEAVSSSSRQRLQRRCCRAASSPALPHTHPHLTTSWSTARRSDTRALTLSVVLSEASVLPTTLRCENCVRSEGGKCWTNLWTLSRGRDWTVEFQVRCCFLLY